MSDMCWLTILNRAGNGLYSQHPEWMLNSPPSETQQVTSPRWDVGGLQSQLMAGVQFDTTLGRIAIYP
jgi:hypothetical protein